MSYTHSILAASTCVHILNVCKILCYVFIRISKEKLWNNLHSNQGEGALRFHWQECKTSDVMCKALDVSRKNIVVCVEYCDSLLF